MNTTRTGNSQERILRLNEMMLFETYQTSGIEKLPIEVSYIGGNCIRSLNVLQSESLLCAEGVTLADDISPWSVTTEIKGRSQLQRFTGMTA